MTLFSTFFHYVIRPLEGKYGVSGNMERTRYTILTTTYFCMTPVNLLLGFLSATTSLAFGSPIRFFWVAVGCLFCSQLTRTCYAKMFFRASVAWMVAISFPRTGFYYANNNISGMFAAHYNVCMAIIGSAAFLLNLGETLIVCLVCLGGTYTLPYFGYIPQHIAKDLMYGIVSMCTSMVGFVGVQRLADSWIRQQADELRVARDEALEASRLKSQFVATMSHEIRTPLNGILGLLEPLLQSTLHDEQREWVKSIETSGRVLLSLANQILDFSRIEAGRMELDHDEFDLRKAVEDVVQVCGITAKPGVDMLSIVDDDVPVMCVGDVTRLQQILVNLLGNASKFTPVGHVVLRVSRLHDKIPTVDKKSRRSESVSSVTSSTTPPKSLFEICDNPETVKKEQLQQKMTTMTMTTENVSGEPIRLLMSVQDSGIGMNELQVSRLFQPFTQADSSHTRKYGGAGLGLTIAKRLSVLMDGDITVTSSQGVGSTFDAKISIYPAAKQPPVKPVQQMDTARNFLVVTSSMINADVYISHLRRAGASSVETLLIKSTGFEEVDRVSQALAKLRDMEGSACVVLDRNDTQIGFWDDVDLIAQRKNVASVILTRHLTSPVMKNASRIVMHKPIRAQRFINAIFNVHSPISSASTTPVLPQQRIFRPLDKDEAEEKELQLIQHRTNSLNLSPGLAADDESAFDENLDNDSPGLLRILVAEDYPVNQIVIRVLLGKMGFKPDIVSNGQLAVEAVTTSSKEYDLILMDLQMPEMDGFSATRAIRDWESRCAVKRRVPVIAVTASGMVDEHKACMESGMDDFIVKPISSDELLSKLHRYCNFT